MTQTWPRHQGAWRLLGQTDSIASEPSVVSAAVVGITGTAGSHTGKAVTSGLSVVGQRGGSTVA